MTGLESSRHVKCPTLSSVSRPRPDLFRARLINQEIYPGVNKHVSEVYSIASEDKIIIICVIDID